MNYFFDTEFHEYQKKPFWGKSIDTIELISIGMVSEKGDEYYAICKDFDVKAAFKNEWLRDNVLFQIYTSWVCGDMRNKYLFTPKCFSILLKAHGWSKKRIAMDIVSFCGESPNFYAYYADYDWFVLCSLWRHIYPVKDSSETDMSYHVPNTFPYYCRDLKQMLDSEFMRQEDKYEEMNRLEAWLKDVKKHPNYPTNSQEHHALADAKWNKELYEFIRDLDNAPSLINNGSGLNTKQDNAV